MRRLVFGAALFVTVFASMRAESLENTRWKLTELNGEAISVENEKQRPHILLEPANQQVRGFGGCNSFNGAYEIKSDHVRFRNMLATLRACADQSMNERERKFMAALDAATTFRLKGDILELSDGSKVLARFSGKE